MAGVVERGKGEVLFVVVYIKLEDKIILLIVEDSLLSIFFCVDCCGLWNTISLKNLFLVHWFLPKHKISMLNAQIPTVITQPLPCNTSFQLPY